MICICVFEDNLLVLNLKRIRRRIIFLLAIWIILLLITFSLLSILAGLFNSNPEGRTIVSLSWAGYIVPKSFNQQRQITSISASWIVPQVNTSAGDGYSSVWIGVGGQTDKTLIQVGTEQDKAGEVGTYYAWYEMLPNYLVRMKGLTISPGDNIDASLTLKDNKTNTWEIQLLDTTKQQKFSLDTIYKSLLASGEWIVERPSVNNQISTLCDFGTVAFSSCQIKLENEIGAIGNFSYSYVEMTNQQVSILASASTLSSDGQAFTVTYVGG
jgi:hypothetical protein